MRKTLVISLAAMAVAVYLAAIPITGFAPEEAPLSEETEECIGCHELYTPGIVADWRTSKHSHITPAELLAGLEGQADSTEIPDQLLAVAVGCYECHGRNTDRHADSFDHEGFTINVVVSPDDCSTCHSAETQQYYGSKKSEANNILRMNPVYSLLVGTLTGVYEMSDAGPVQREPTAETLGVACLGCHGTQVTVSGMRTVATDFGDIEVPRLENWPNQGVGRINPDGSHGSCTPCHPRHSFSIEVARKPYTCLQCHLNPDVPGWEVYRESKHGNIFLSSGHDWNWDSEFWTVGEDFRAPTCAVCHNSLIVDAEGQVIAERTHDFGARLWVRIFGLVYSHPQPRSGRTYEIVNGDGLPIPTTFAGVRASTFLIDEAEQARRRAGMSAICRACHSSSWTEEYFATFDQAIEDADSMVLAATRMMLDAWEEGLASPENPFDEALERKWIAQWLFYANSVRYAAAMSGPDYAAFKNGWWDLTRNLQEMIDSIELHRHAER